MTRLASLTVLLLGLLGCGRASTPAAAPPPHDPQITLVRPDGTRSPLTLDAATTTAVTQCLAESKPIPLDQRAKAVFEEGHYEVRFTQGAADKTWELRTPIDLDGPGAEEVYRNKCLYPLVQRLAPPPTHASP